MLCSRRNALAHLSASACETAPLVFEASTLTGSLGVASTLAGGTTSEPQAFQAARAAAGLTDGLGEGEALDFAACWLQVIATSPAAPRARIRIVNPTLCSV